MMSFVFRLSVVLMTLFTVVSCVTPSPEKIAAAFRASSRQLRSTGKVAAVEMEAASTVKYLNLFGYSDDNCETVDWSMYLPLGQCLPNVVWQGIIGGNFVKWFCDTSSCVVKSYKDSTCTKSASGTHRVSMDIPSGCSTELEGFVSVTYGFSATMPYHSSGLMEKLYKEDDCSGPHVTFYSPDSCSANDDDDNHGSRYYDCTTGKYRQYSSTDCTGDYTLETLQAPVMDYGVCETISTGGSSTEVCGGVGSINYSG
jgi:hypothetical protein